MSDDRTVPRQSTDIDRALTERSHPQQVELIKRELSPLITPDSVDWVFALADIWDRNAVTLTVLRRCASELAWAARERGQRMPGDQDWRRCGEAKNPQAASLSLAYVRGFRLLQDFRFDELAAATRQWLAAHPDDALLHSLAVFATLGQRSDRAEPLLQRVSTMPDYDSTCRAVCLQGLWFGSHLSDQADRIIALSDEMIGRGEDGANLYYWRAFALRRLGRFDDALTSIDRAIALLPVGMNAVHQDYSRERETIGTTRLLNEQIQSLTGQLGTQVEALASQLGDRLNTQFVRHQQEMREEMDEHSRMARQVVSDSLLGIVEVLALFVTLAGFLIGSGALVLQANGFGQSVAAVAVLAVGAVSFFALLRMVVRFDRGRSPGGAGSRRGLRLLRLGDAKD